MNRAKLRRVIVATALMIGATGSVTMASAATVDAKLTASCTATSDFASNGAFYSPSAANKIIVYQTKTSPGGITSHIRLKDNTGTSSATYAVKDGQGIAFTKTKPKTARVEARAAMSANCNGVSPGNGNYQFYHRVVH